MKSLASKSPANKEEQKTSIVEVTESQAIFDKKI